MLKIYNTYNTDSYSFLQKWFNVRYTKQYDGKKKKQFIFGNALKHTKGICLSFKILSLSIQFFEDTIKWIEQK